MATRREKQAHLNPDQQIAEIHDDLDDGERSFAELRTELKTQRRETRALLIGIIVAVIGTGMWSNL